MFLRLLISGEAQRWVGKFANMHSHMGNRTSGRAESFHSGLKAALGHQSAAKLPVTAMRMHNYYKNKVTKLQMIYLVAQIWF